MGQRGPLRLVSARVTPEDALEGSAQQDVGAGSHKLYKPRRVAESESLNELWEEIVPEMEKAGLVTALDVPAIEIALRHYRAYLALDEQWANDRYEGVIMEQGAHGVTFKKNPIEVAHRSQSAIFIEYSKQLGMTFAARARTPGRDNDSSSSDDNPFLSGG